MPRLSLRAGNLVRARQSLPRSGGTRAPRDRDVGRLLPVAGRAVSDDQRLIAVVGGVAERLSPGALSALVTALRANGSRSALVQAVASRHYEDVVRELCEVWTRTPSIDADSLALAIE